MLGKSRSLMVALCFLPTFWTSRVAVVFLCLLMTACQFPPWIPVDAGGDALADAVSDSTWTAKEMLMSNEPPGWLTECEHGFTRLDIPNIVKRDNSVSEDLDGDRLRVAYFKHTAEGTLTGKVWFGPGTKGPPGFAHGGSIAAILDEAIGGAAWMSGHMAVAGELTVRYRQLVPLGTACIVEPRLASVNGQMVKIRAVIKDRDGQVYAEGEALFITVDAEKLGDMVGAPGTCSGEIFQSRSSSPRITAAATPHCRTPGPTPLRPSLRHGT